VTDAQLVLLARGGDEVAAQRLVRRHRDVIGFHVRDYFAPGLERDDLFAEGLLGLTKAIRDYRPDRDSGFRNFADLCIKRQILTAVNTARRKKHTPLNGAASLQAPVGDDDGSTLGDLLPSHLRQPIELLEADEEREKLEAGFRSLTPLEYRSIQGVADGIPYVAIADGLGVEEKVIDNAAQRARRKLSTALAVA
jgi:RNA polymerase sporulation-specific sigma factor